MLNMSKCFRFKIHHLSSSIIYHHLSSSISIFLVISVEHPISRRQQKQRQHATTRFLAIHKISKLQKHTTAAPRIRLRARPWAWHHRHPSSGVFFVGWRVPGHGYPRGNIDLERNHDRILWCSGVLAGEVICISLRARVAIWTNCGN